MGNYNIDRTNENCSEFDKLEELCDRFNLINLIKSETCYTNNHKSTIDLFFTANHYLFKKPPLLKLDKAIVTSWYHLL